jgi:hypothetical protein
MVSGFSIFAAVRNFNVLTEDDNARPFFVAANFIDLHTNQRIQPHPFNLPSQRRETAQAVRVE